MSEFPYNIVLVVGVPRSGTTFLQIVLAAHPGVATARETHLFDRYLGPLLDQYRNEEESLKSADGIRHHIGRAALNRHLRSIALSMLAAIQGKSPDASVVLEKTPDHLTRMPMISECLPEARFIHLVRDPRGVAASMKAAGMEAWGFWAEKSPFYLAKRWLENITFATEFGPQLTDRYRQIRYEDLFVSGGTLINELFSWLGLAADETLPDDLTRRYPISAMARITGEPTEPRNEPRERFFRRGDPQAWRQELTWSEIGVIEAVCGERMIELGYSPVVLSAEAWRRSGGGETQVADAGGDPDLGRSADNREQGMCEPSTPAITEYLAQSRDTVQAAIDDPSFATMIAAIVDRVAAALAAGHKLLLAGNGGSAGDAQHIAGEFLSRLNYDRAPAAAIALTTDSSVLTAIGNDYGYERVFERQVLGLGRPGDVLIAISTSGRSPNILRAIAAARESGLVTIGFTGKTGGDMASCCDLCLHVPSDSTPLIQQIHITAGHIVCGLVEERLFPREATAPFGAVAG